MSCASNVSNCCLSTKGGCLRPPKPLQMGKLRASEKNGLWHKWHFSISWISPTKTGDKCCIPWDKAQLGLQHLGADPQWMGCVHSQALSLEGCSIVLLCCWTWKLPGCFFFFYQLNILGAEAWLVFLIIPSPDIFYLAFWIFLARTCAILSHLVCLSSSSFSSNRIFIDFHCSGRKKTGEKKKVALFSLSLLFSLFSPPTWIIRGVSAAWRAHYKSVHPSDSFAYIILNLSSD